MGALSKDHIDTENYEPYTAIFEAKIDKVGLLDGNDVLKIEVDVYVGYELETKSNESINGDGNDALVKLTADTNFSFEPTIDIKVDIESGKLVKAHAFVKGLTKFDATLSIESDGSKDLHGSKNLISRSFVKVIAPGGVPIIVRGKFKLDAEINGKAEGSVKLSHILESTLNITTGFAYDNGNWDPRTHFDPTLKYRIEGEAKAKVYGDVRLIPSLELFFYEAATGKIIVEPYLYAEAGVEGHYRSEASLETGVDTQLDYRFTEMAAGIGAELKLRAALEIFDKTIIGWPSRDKDEYKTITLMAKTPVIGIPSIAIEDITNPLNVNSCLIELKATVTPIYKPFSSTEPSIAWQSDSIGWAGFPLAANDTIWATTSNGDNEFYAQATLTSKTDYDLRFGGHSRLGSWARQYQDLSIDFSPDDSSSLPTYWANRYGLSQALADDDNDGLTNIEEFENCTVPNNRDSDGDEMLDGDEIKYNLNPLVNDASDDADNDGIPNLVEVQEGGNPNVANEAPTAKIINLQYNVEASTLVLGVEASDPDGQIISYKWREEGTSVATIESPTSSQTTIYLPIVQQDTVLRFSVTVEDNLYVTTTEYFEVVVPYIEPVNQPPVAVIEAKIVDLEVLIDGAKSSDLEDDEAGLPLSYLWEQLAGPNVVINDPTSVNTWFDFPIVEEDTELEFVLTVTDSDGASSTSSLKIQIDGPENSSPIADAGDDQVAESGQVVIISGAGSEDFDNDALFYTWQQTDNSGFSVDISNPNEVIVNFVAPTVTEDTTLSFELSVTDNKGEPSTATVNVLVSPQSTDIESGLIAYLPLDGDLAELTGISASINEVGTVVYVTGAVEEGVDLDGSSSLIAISEAPRATNQLTISAWVNPKEQTNDEYTGGGVVINSPIYELSLNSINNTILYSLTDNSRVSNKVDTGVPVPQGEWSHIVVVYNGVQVVIYLNGVEVNRVDYSEEMPGGTWPMGIGAKYIPVELGAPESGWYSHFKGSIDEVRLYDRAINTSEIETLFAQQSETSETPAANTLLESVSLSELEGTIVEIRGSDESDDWVWVLKFTHDWPMDNYFLLI
ncbi:LamG domain-containing protein [Psychrosphaera algicola]|uniref:LamG-like jellyroll fold domain-containing protein n=1 Tax=Psychrosphaera algicola TaxID=3023714 RepID=A0ABT5FAW5_9GAMM|nr:LamG-like jellyroll fold domain-containing protein [Psychrosphaera sp. G1-22]MDC2888685.1 hypothetical protein [Psychrosphaera sp. G1-22]